MQQALPGLEFSIDCFGDLDGAALGAVPRAMIQSKGGEQIKGETLDDPQLVELGAATVEGLGLVGPSTVQCFREDGRILGITDINTRFGGAFPLPQAAGAGYVQMILAIAAGERPGSAARRPRAGRRDDPVPRADAPEPHTDRARPARPRGLGSAVVEREITLRDYGRVIWSGRWLILTAAVVAAVVGLALSFATSTTYTATAELFVGQATSVSGTPVSTPGTNPTLVPIVLTGDNLVGRVAKEVGVTPGRIRKGVELTAPKAPGGSVGNLPTVITITFKDSSKKVARDAANAYALAIEAQAKDDFSGVTTTYETAIATAEATVSRLETEIASYRRQLASASGDRLLVLQSLLSSSGQLLQTATTELSDQRLNLVKEQQFQPGIISLATSPSSSGSVPNRLRSVILAGVIGLLVGIIVTFVWRGSPAGRASNP